MRAGTTFNVFKSRPSGASVKNCVRVACCKSTFLKWNATLLLGDLPHTHNIQIIQRDGIQKIDQVYEYTLS